MDFGFDDGKVVKVQGLDRFKINTSGQSVRISIIAFRKYHDVILANKRKEGEELTDSDKAELITNIDAKLAERLGKSIDDLTEVDRLDIKAPRFSMSHVHYKDGIGTIRCLSKYQGGQLQEAEVCCKDIGDAEQLVATICLAYPCDKDGNPDMELIKLRKMVSINTLRLSAKKFKKVESVYGNARANDLPVIDLSCQLDGDPKYQKWAITNGLTAIWARDDADPEFRNWVLEEGIRNYKHVKNELGFEMKKDQLIAKLRGGPEGANYSGSNHSAAAPQIASTDYKGLLD